MTVECLQEVLLSLLRAALWQHEKAENALAELSADDWQEVIEAARKQALVGVVYDALSLSDMPASISNQWKAEASAIAHDYQRHLLSLNNISARMQSECGITPIVGKGLALAACYPTSYRRSAGDIDLYYRSVDEKWRADDCFRRWGMPIVEGKQDESATSFNGITIENHGQFIFCHSPFVGKRDRKMVSEKILNGSALTEKTIDGVPLLTFNPEFTLLLLFSHSYKHLLSQGIGLRQLCDVAMYLRAEHAAIDGLSLKVLLRKWGLERWANVVFAFCISRLGMPREMLPYDVEVGKWSTDRLLQEVWQAGNLGQMDNRDGARPQGTLRGRQHTARRIVRNMRHFARYAPAESVGWFTGLVLRRAVGQ